MSFFLPDLSNESEEVQQQQITQAMTVGTIYMAVVFIVIMSCSLRLVFFMMDKV